MKKFLVLFLAATMVLSLTGCGKKAKLYEKYSELITEMENGEFDQAMSTVAEIAAVEQADERMQQAEEDRAAVMQSLLSSWHLLNNWEADAPESLTISADGICSIEGTDMKWMEKHAEDEWIEGIVTNGEKNVYFFQCYDDPDTDEIAELSLYTCEENEHDIYPGDHLATYVNNPMYPVLFTSWHLLDGTEGMMDYMHFGRQEMSCSDKGFKWTSLTDGKDDTLAVQVAGFRNTTEEYTMELAKKDGHYVITAKDDATGAFGFYCNDDYGYETSWDEYLYPQALDYLEDYLEYNSFWCREDDLNYQDHEAGAYLYNLFSELGDYRDSAEILGRFTVLPDMFQKAVVSRVDNLGNTSSSKLEFYNYDEKGRIVNSYCEENIALYGENDSWDGLLFTYDDNDRISQVQYGNVTALITPEYDASGKMTAAKAQYNTAAYDYTYSYNDAGQLIFSDISNSNYKRTFELTYTEDGKLLQKTFTRDSSGWKDITVTDYVYDAQGYLISKQLSEYDVNYANKKTLDSVTTYTYTNDANGRPISAEIASEPNDKYSSQVVEYIYADLYFYAAE